MSSLIPSRAAEHCRDNVMKIVDLRKFEVVKEISDDNYTNTSTTNRACFSSDAKYVLVGGNPKILVFEAESARVGPFLTS